MAHSLSTTPRSRVPPSTCSPTGVDVFPSPTSPTAKTPPTPVVAEGKSKDAPRKKSSKEEICSRDFMVKFLRGIYNGEVSKRDLKSLKYGGCTSDWIQFLHPGYISDAALLNFGVQPNEIQNFRANEDKCLVENWRKYYAASSSRDPLRCTSEWESSWGAAIEALPKHTVRSATTAVTPVKHAAGPGLVVAERSELAVVSQSLAADPVSSVIAEASAPVADFAASKTIEEALAPQSLAAAPASSVIAEASAPVADFSVTKTIVEAKA